MKIKEPVKFRNNGGLWRFGICIGFVAGGKEDDDDEDKIYLCRERKGVEFLPERRYSECVNI